MAWLAGERVGMWANAYAFSCWGQVPEPRSQHRALVCPSYLTLVPEAQLEALPPSPSCVQPSPTLLYLGILCGTSAPKQTHLKQIPISTFSLKSAKIPHSTGFTAKYQKLSFLGHRCT